MSEFMTVAEVVSGSGLADETVRKHIARGWLKAQQIGGPRGRIRVATADYFSWLNQSPVKSAETIHDTDWSSPDPRFFDPNNDFEECGAQTGYVPVHVSRLAEFGRKQAELGLSR